MQYDEKEITNILKLIFQPGDVFEIRCLNATIPGMRYSHTESGYFDYEHIDAVPKELAKIEARGVYFTPNPVNPALLARAANRIKQAGKNESTADSDTLCRRWLLIDCDAVRPPGISTSDEEHEAALYKAIEVSEKLKSQSWPEPVMLDSGNGAQLMYRIEEPTVDNGLIQNCLKALDSESDEQVKIDISVHNPARIWRLPGTMNCKGDEIEDRVYRQARVISYPKTIQTVSHEKLHALAYPENPPGSNGADTNTSNGFDLEAWISQYCPEAEGPEVWKDGLRWIFPVCPFNEAHDNRSAVIIQQANGAIAFKCHHDGCAGKNWHDLRTLREPERDQNREVDLSQFLAKILAKENEPSSKEYNPIPMPDELYAVPGFISAVTDFCMRTAPYPNKPLAFAGAITLQAHLAARKIQAPGGLRTNPYMITLARSGSGKDHPRKINNRILSHLGLGAEVKDKIASSEGLEDALVITPALLWQADEFYSFLLDVAQDKTGTKELIISMILTLFSSASVTIKTRIKAGCQTMDIPCPNLTILGNSTPSGFFDVLNKRMLEHGLFSRMTIFLANSRGHGQMPGNLDSIPDSIVAMAQEWRDFRPPGSGNLGSAAMTVPVTAEAEAVFQQVREEADEKYFKRERNGAREWELAILSRILEHVMKFSLIYAASAAPSPEHTVITEDAVLWAKKLITWETDNKIEMTEHKYHETEFVKYSEQVIDILANWHKRNGRNVLMPGWKFNRRIKSLPPKSLAAVIESLEKQERIIVQHLETAGRLATNYGLME